jgi:hypothetical protein
MTLKELAHLAQQTLHTRAGCPVKRSRVHELLAAAFGHRSWAAFHSDSLLADSRVGAAPTGGLPDLIGRAVQLGYEQQAAATIATTLQDFIAGHRLSAVSLADLRAARMPTTQVIDRDDLDAGNDHNDHNDHNDGIDDDDGGWDDESPKAEPSTSGPAREQLMGSPMLLSSLEHAAGPSNPQGHFLLAALFRCGRPSPDLHEESRKGRVLTAIERGFSIERPLHFRNRWFADFVVEVMVVRERSVAVGKQQSRTGSRLNGCTWLRRTDAADRGQPLHLARAWTTARPWHQSLRIGNDRMRSPVAAKYALAKAGATGGTGGSPTPPGGSVGSPPTRCVRITRGACDMRSTS